MIVTNTFYSENLENERNMYIYLPPSYEDNEDDTYPVMYMQDGQNIFSEYAEGGRCWDMDLTADELIENGEMEEIIIVGVSNTEWRDEEYTPTEDENEQSGGYGDLYLKFLIEEVKDYMDNNFRVRPFREDTCIGGSSLGGLLSLYAAITYPEYFGKIAVISPSIWWDNQLILGMAQEWDIDPADMKIWLDMGMYEISEEELEDGETDPMVEADMLCEILKSKGFKRGKNLRYFTDYWGSHDESSWGHRIGRVFKFLFPRA